MRTSLAVELLRCPCSWHCLGKPRLFAGVCWEIFANWHANLARIHARGWTSCVTLSYTALRDGSVKDVACRARTNASSKTKSFTFLMRHTASVLELRTRLLRLHTKKLKRGAAGGLTIVAWPPSRLLHVQCAFHKPHGTVHTYAWRTNLMA